MSRNPQLLTIESASQRFLLDLATTLDLAWLNRGACKAYSSEALEENWTGLTTALRSPHVRHTGAGALKAKSYAGKFVIERNLHGLWLVSVETFIPTEGNVKFGLDGFVLWVNTDGSGWFSRGDAQAAEKAIASILRQPDVVIQGWM